MTAPKIPSPAEATDPQMQLALLLNVCGESGHAFEFAADGSSGIRLRAELAQYGTQRREFVDELSTAIVEVCESTGAAVDGDVDVRKISLDMEAAVKNDNRVAMIEECQRSDQATLDAYRNVMQLHLPHAVNSMCHSHFYAINRIQSRLQHLADAASSV